MEYERTVEDYLAEIESETLQQFLSNVRLGEGSSRQMSTRLPLLDACFSSDSSNLARKAVQPGDVIEIQGPSSSGKTHLAYHFTISCVLPAAGYRGWGQSAVVFDTDGTFQGQANASYTEDLISSCLRKVHIFRPQSSPQLAATILNLGNLHATHPRFSDEEIGLVVIDSLSSFYWQDRFTIEQLRSGPSSQNAKNPLQHVITALDRLRTSHRPVILLTNWALNSTDKPSPQTGLPATPFFKQHLQPFSRPPLALANEVSSITSDDHDTLTQPNQTSAVNRPNTAVSQSTRLQLTHHITLSLPFLPHYAPDDHMEIIQGKDVTINSRNVKVEGLMRVPGSDQIKKFTFCVCETDIRQDDDVTQP